MAALFCSLLSYKFCFMDWCNDDIEFSVGCTILCINSTATIYGCSERFSVIIATIILTAFGYLKQCFD